MSLRFRLVFLGIVFLFLLVVARLFYWQIVRASELSLIAQSQYGNTLVLHAERGEIKTSDNFPIAANKISYQVFVNPKEIKNAGETATILAAILNVDLASVSADLALDKFWVAVKSGVDLDTKEKLEKLDLPGVGFESQYQRFYPEASMAAQLLGFVGKDDQGNDKGYFGLEGYYERLLHGKDGMALEVHDAFGRPILAQASSANGKIDGSSLILSIDRSIQYLVEGKIKDGVEQYGATSGMVGVMDPKTGRILAMAAYPNFDPRSYQDYSEDLYKNPFISNLYEPGSTFKPIVMASALNAKVVKPETKCNICAGPISVSDYTIHTWNDKYYKDTDMIDVIMHSDNTGMVFVAQKLGLTRMLDYLGKFGIGTTTGVDLQGEVSAPLKPKNQWYAVDLATAGFGQGISVTPIELLNAISTIANGGVEMQPQVVSAVEDPQGNVVNISPKTLGSPIDSGTAKAMTEIMVNAVNKGEASWARLKGYRIAGKTGTASIPIRGHYDPNQTIASFVGFAPVENPKFVILVILNRPTASIYGAETAAPIFFDIAKSLLGYYGISPEGN